MVRLPAAALTPDVINVVLDDDYGLRSLPEKPGTIVDIGANVGVFSAFARSLFPEAVIHAYEPVPATAEWARLNAADPCTTVFCEGVSSRAGLAVVADLGPSNLARTTPSESGTIPLVSFARVVERIGAIDLLKIDCEGAEWDFMTDPVPFARVRRIRMEYHLVDGKTLADLDALASKVGFRISKLVENAGFGIAWLERGPA